ncbi:MAG: CDP-alcohol phosphatidyltransferase family protein [Spirochaetaceae bacterium]|nr:CDP-alcohol phosphatidyltransferase family protein [Spirochaetaceae bacterium]MDT8298309.1 CDP-alcohol phosphatidyltransferase family protein [Spirochaetaceae bacterium]
MIDTSLRKYLQKAFDVMARPLIAAGLSPTQVTLAAALLGLAGCAFTLQGTFPFRMAAIGIGALSALLDILDGTVARATDRSSPLGAFLDLVLDRIVEAVFIMAYAYAFPITIWPAMVFLTLVIINFSAFLLAGSLFPNTGKKSLHYEGGLVERTETFLLFGLMLVFPVAAPWLIWGFNALMFATAIHRFYRVVRFARENGLDGRTAKESSK